ncbi:MAG: iron-containing alcohol dehydrogenase, partial [Bacillota bacterium]
MANTYFNFKLPTEIEFGPGCLKNLADKIKVYHGTKVMIITDKGVVMAGILERVTGQLTASRIPFIVFDQVESDPGISTVEQIAFQAKE